MFVSLKAQLINDITPKPVQVKELKQESAILLSGSVLAYDHFFAAQAIYLREQIRLQCGIAVILGTAPANKS